MRRMMLSIGGCRGVSCRGYRAAIFAFPGWTPLRSRLDQAQSTDPWSPLQPFVGVPQPV